MGPHPRGASGAGLAPSIETPPTQATSPSIRSSTRLESSYLRRHRSMNDGSSILTAFLTAVITSIITVWGVQRYGILPPRAPAAVEVVVPDLRGVPENDAQTRAYAAQLALFVASREPNAEAKPGTVIRQSVAGGQRVPRAFPLSVVLAEEVPKVPGVTGIAVTDATQRLEKAGYHLQVSATVPHPALSQGLIIEQAPKADTVQPKGGTVMVQVSAGPGDVELPKFVGVNINQAKTDVEKLGLKANVKWVALAETPTYVVLSQKPPPGEKVKPGSEVLFTACK